MKDGLVKKTIDVLKSRQLLQVSAGIFAAAGTFGVIADTARWARYRQEEMGHIAGALGYYGSRYAAPVIGGIAAGVLCYHILDALGVAYDLKKYTKEFLAEKRKQNTSQTQTPPELPSQIRE